MRLIFGSRLRHKDSFPGWILRNQGPGKAQPGTGNVELEGSGDYIIGGEWGVTCRSGTHFLRSCFPTHMWVSFLSA